jgi:hypothetical protein
LSAETISETVAETAGIDVSPSKVNGEAKREPSLIAMIAAALVLLVVIGAILWAASSTPNGRSVVITVRNP